MYQKLLIKILGVKKTKCYVERQKIILNNIKNYLFFMFSYVTYYKMAFRSFLEVQYGVADIGKCNIF